MKLDINSNAETMGLGNPRFCQAPQSDSRWAALESAVATFLNTLASTPQVEYVGLVSYSSDDTYCSFTNNASDINQLLNSDESLVAGAMSSITATVFNGMTNITAGIDSGVTVLTDPSLARPFAAKTMVLFTDGHRTAGRPPRDAADDALAERITIHTCENAAYEGARRGIVPGATQQNVIDMTQAILSSASVSNVLITVTPTTITADTQEVTVVVSVPIDSNSWITPLFFQGKTASASCTLQREKYSYLL